ncbi:cytochrome c peroxidase [Ferruginibacter paludis]|uniref:cytochrome-c peroxidase n=1 Tax=Ferruginibacter paludis TaxID=1310417 RepID=UPI0025B41BAE|nr:cytochrome c peroxidase [Ferruginibacter paludis]MDN3654928.1 cytochrome c peroxidase [Ferruginibacter paludis]
MPRRLLFVIILLTGLVILFCSACLQAGDKTEASHPKKAFSDPGSVSALPLTVIHPRQNPFTNEKAALGRLLFYDPILSGDKDVSCASCHHPEFGYAENIDLSIGVGGVGLSSSRYFRHADIVPPTKRNSQSILNTAFNGIDINGDYDPEKAPMFWDLRATSLEDQSLHPIRQFEEMRGTAVEEKEVLNTIISRLGAIPVYRTLFKSVFGSDTSITSTNLAKAIACFERTLIANQSRFDLYMRGQSAALSSSEKEGFTLFMNAGCARCHSGPMFSDFKVHIMGTPDADKRKDIDSGYHNSFAFRTPSLRNLRFTWPYMHSGKITNLEDVLTFYEDLRGKPLKTKYVQEEQLDSLAKQVRIEFKDIPRIVEFLNTLNDAGYDHSIPESVPSKLAVGGNIKLKK